MLTAEGIVAQTERLASLPAAYIRVKEVIDDPDGSIAQLAQAISTDAAMTARVLRVVNSPLFGFPGRIETVTRALNILGMLQVHDAVLAWAISSTFADVSSSVLPMPTFWRKSVRRALAARHMARRAQFVDAERLFVEGLLSDIGHLVLYAQVPDLAKQAMELSSHMGRALHEVERESIGCDYAQVGAALVSAWGLPQAFMEPIACQVNPSAASNYPVEAAILHIAGALAECGGDRVACRPEPFALDIVEMDEMALSEAHEQAGLELDSVVAALFPNLRAA